MLRTIARVAINLITIVAVGELVLRIDQKYHPFAPEEMLIETVLSDSGELEQVVSGQLPIEPSDLRVLVLGDSYIHGAGVPSGQSLSHVLRRQLQAIHQEGAVYVLDASRPSNNTLDNYNTFVRFYDSYRPTHVVLGYNLNDILGGLSAFHDDEEVAADTSNGPGRRQASGALPDRTEKHFGTLRTITKAVYRNLELARFLSARLQDTLKIEFGIVLPFGSFHHLTHRAYSPNNVDWQTTQQIFQRMARMCAASQTRLVVYKFPEIHLIERMTLFERPDTELQRFFSAHPEVVYIDGNQHFRGENAKEYQLNRYDGHPNAKAHKRMAMAVLARMTAERLPGEEPGR